MPAAGLTSRRRRTGAEAVTLFLTKLADSLSAETRRSPAMSDHDRGAYAPQHDGPSLSFDARRGRSRGPAPFTLIFSGVVLAALIGAIFLFYRGGVREAGAPPQTVGQPVVAMKGPASAGVDGPVEEAESLDVYVDEAASPPPVTAAVTASAASSAAPAPVQVAATGPAPAFTAPPEQPQPRPAPRPAPPTAARPAPPPVVRTPAAAPASRPVQTASAAPASTAPRPGQVATVTIGQRPPSATPPRPAPTAASTASARPTQVATAAPLRPTPAAAAPATTGGGYGVQIGAFSSQAIADAEFAKIAGSYASGRGKAVTPVPSGGATLYRTVVTGFSSREQATAVCAQMKAAGKTCFVR